jgi:hypothetical protein
VIAHFGKSSLSNFARCHAQASIVQLLEWVRISFS